MSESMLGIGILGVSPTRGWAATAHIPALRALANYEIRAQSAQGAESARAMAALAAEHGGRSAVGLQARQAPAIGFLQELLGSGYVGGVRAGLRRRRRTPRAHCRHREVRGIRGTREDVTRCATPGRIITKYHERSRP
jgi:predicted dehydrogenase